MGLFVGFAADEVSKVIIIILRTAAILRHGV